MTWRTLIDRWMFSRAWLQHPPLTHSIQKMQLWSCSWKNVTDLMVASTICSSPHHIISLGCVWGILALCTCSYHTGNLLDDKIWTADRHIPQPKAVPEQKVGCVICFTFKTKVLLSLSSLFFCRQSCIHKVHILPWDFKLTPVCSSWLSSIRLGGISLVSHIQTDVGAL